MATVPSFEFISGRIKVSRILVYVRNSSQT